MTDHVVPSEPRPELLRIYLNDHLAGSTGGLALARRIAGNHERTAAGPELVRFVRELEDERASLVAIMTKLGARRDPVKALLAVAGERLGRLKLNGTLLRRSPLSSVTELEMMRIGVEGKSAGWRTLRELSDGDSRLDAAQLDGLIEQAERQSEFLEQLRVQAVAEALRG